MVWSPPSPSTPLAPYPLLDFYLFVYFIIISLFHTKSHHLKDPCATSEPQTWMFSEMRRELGIPKSVDILNHIHSLPAPSCDIAMEAVKAIEQSAMVKMVPQPGLNKLMTYLDSHDILKGICTRNFDGPVAHLCRTFLPGITFPQIVTRAFKPPKPHPAGILHICAQWGVGGNEVIMVGDSIDDMEAGRRAGSATVLLRNDGNKEVAEHEFTDYVIWSLDELVNVLERGFEGQDRAADVTAEKN